MPRRCSGEQRSAAQRMCYSSCPAHLNQRCSVLACMRLGWHPLTPRTLDHKRASPAQPTSL